MNRKLKLFSALFSAALLASAIAVVSAPAEEGGHFVSEVHHTTLLGGQDTSVGASRMELHDTVLGSIHCQNEEELTGTITGTTVTSVTITPHYKTNCTQSGSTKTVHVHMNGCQYTFTVAKEPTHKHNTVHLICPPGKSVTLTVTLDHSNTVACIVHIGAQTPKGGVTYTTTGSVKTHAITSEVTVSGIKLTRTPQFFGGCLFAPENGEGELTGDAFLEGRNAEGTQVGITAT